MQVSNKRSFFEKPKIRWEDNIIWDLKEVDYGCYEGDWKALAQEGDMACFILAAMNLRFHNASE